MTPDTIEAAGVIAAVVLLIVIFTVALAAWVDYVAPLDWEPTPLDEREAEEAGKSVRDKLAECGDADTAWMSAHSIGRL